ncbi:uncharacterized protein LOC114528583 [Dendronephthya gigantea]|uniref:uncharacterized protein LOC114528583 n=1 Tax=Dendronephthya gigantea TaxID=151771 RepID=UPI00106D4FB7|nr:uncharacterized protein LOC114528583 [Dendronephthya gigantea]
MSASFKFSKKTTIKLQDFERIVGKCERMDIPQIVVRQDNLYDNVSSPETGHNDERPSTSMEYNYLALPLRPRRLKRDSMSSVDSNSSGKLSIDEEQPEQASPSETPKRTGKKRGRKPTQMNLEAKLERSRQSARECRARKKLRYQGLEDTIAEKEARVYALRKEVNKYVGWAKAIDSGTVPDDLAHFLDKAQPNVKSED